MGLDMYLSAKKFHSAVKTDRKKIDGMELEEETLVAGYWRKHADLHGYIVTEFADGVDNCEEIDLDSEALRKIADAVEADQLPHTEGFFFRRDRKGEEAIALKTETMATLRAAADWLDRPEDFIWKSVVYRASW